MLISLFLKPFYRAMLYEVLEEFLFKFGMDGKACLLRAICEMHESPLLGYGLFGEMLELFLTYVFSMWYYITINKGFDASS